METQTISDPLGWFLSDTRHKTNNLVNVDTSILYLIAISPLDSYWQPSSLLLGGIMPTIIGERPPNTGELGAFEGFYEV